VDLQLIAEIVESRKAGSRIFLGRDSKGAPKVKVRAGFLGLSTRRYQPGEDTYQAIKDILKKGGGQ
jgi:hypothetical protein